MPETKSKKIRLYKYAAEYNLSTEAIIDFLIKKDYKVKAGNINTSLTEEMINDINNHFKKDIEKAEKHYKKIAEFQKKREQKAEEEQPKEVAPVEPEKVEEEVEEEVEEVLAEEAPQEAEEEIEAPPVEEAPEPEEAVETPPELKAPEKEKEAKAFRSPKEAEVQKRKGLTVVGKINLEEKKEAKKPAPPPKKTDEKKAAEKKAADDLEDKKKKKTKRKKIIEPEETPLAKKKKRVKKFEIDDKDVKAAIRKTLLSMDEASATAKGGNFRRRKRREREAEEQRKQDERTLQKSRISVTEFISVNELANLMNVPVAEVIAKCIELGLMVSINQRLDVETITLVADEFDFEIELQEEYSAEALEDHEDPEDKLELRSPVVTIMGHVDHGKTSVLDYIRSTNVVAGESGGITQHIGAYKVEVSDGKYIAFLDTPGHEAFTAMRARGAQLTDIVILIVAADDAVMPQTVEAINHAQAANVPIIIAINKIDKPGSNSDKIKQQLADRNVLVEEWGGKYQCVEVSAKTGHNMDKLLEQISLEAELLELKANPDRNARGAVVEAELDKGRGITVTVLVQKGTLKIGDPFVAGIYQGKVRAMFDERGNKVDKVGPSTPVQVLGFEGAPQAGDTFVVVESERKAREIGLKRQQLKREQDQKQVRHLTLEEIGKQISIGGVKELPLIVKGDVDGSVEALSDSLMKLSNQEVIVRVIHKGVGGISESDVLLAAASNAIIIGFHVRPNLNARKTAETQEVDIRLYSVIYDAIDEVKLALEGLLSPVISEEVVATVEIRETFKVPKFGTVAGCYVLDGKITRNSKIRLIRDGIVIHEGEIGSLKRFKDDVREVDAGYECGLNIAGYNDIKVNDIIEAFKLIETKKKLE